MWLSYSFCKVNDIVIYWGFRHREQSVLGVMEALFLCLRELVRSSGVATILLFQKTSQRFYYLGLVVYCIIKVQKVAEQKCR